MAGFSKAALDYLRERGIDPAIAAGVGVTEGRGWIVWPTFDVNGNPSPRRRRLSEAKPKVIGEAHVKPGIWWAEWHPTTGGAVLVCEGEPDALSALTTLGQPVRIVAIPGSDFPPDQLAQDLHRVGAAEAVLAFDGDEGGRRAAEKAAAVLSEAQLRVRVLHLDDGEDLASTLVREGAAWLVRAILNAPVIDPVRPAGPSQREFAQVKAEVEALRYEVEWRERRWRELVEENARMRKRAGLDVGGTNA